MSDTQRPGTSRSSISPTEPDAVDGLHPTETYGVDLGFEHDGDMIHQVMDLDAGGVVTRYHFHPSIDLVGLELTPGEEVPITRRYRTVEPLAWREAIPAAASGWNSFPQGGFGTDAQEARGDADAATMSENAQSPRATPKYAEVQLTTAEQMRRRDDLVAISDSRLAYMNLPWWKRLVSSRP